MNFSPYQEAIFAAFDAGRSLRVDAVAGSGKTTTLVELAKRCEKGKLNIFLAFNNSIADELGQKLPYWVQSSTFHSYCWSAVKQGFPNIKLAKKKTDDLFSDMVEDREFYKNVQSVKKLVGLMKGSTMTPEELIDYHDIDTEDPEQLVAWAWKVFNASNRNTASADFDDMLFFATRPEVSFVQADAIFVDEAQDLNEIQRELLKKMLKRDGRLIIVGDPHQSIYGFRGADVDSMDELAEAFELETLPLSVSYRCSTSVVNAARRFVPHILARDDAPAGTVANVSLDFTKFPDGCGVLCRNTAPVIQLALKLLKHGRPTKVLGRDIGAGLKRTVKSFKAADMQELRSRMLRWRDREVAKFEKKHQRGKAATVEDKYAALTYIIEDCVSVSAVETKIDFLFRETPASITCSTVHKAKGLEYDTVFILNRELMPSKYAEQEWQLRQEKNIQYVAITRAKENLYYISL
jgi:superfamily I DNA/RNA helicase